MKIIKLDTGAHVYAAHLMSIQSGVNFGFLVLTTIADTLGKNLDEALPLVEKVTGGADPKEAIPFVMQILGSLDADKLATIAKKAFDGEVYVDDEKLSNAATFEKHFSKNRGDYFPVLVWLVWNNVRPFLSGSGATWAAVMGGQASKSQSS